MGRLGNTVAPLCSRDDDCSRCLWRDPPTHRLALACGTHALGGQHRGQPLLAGLGGGAFVTLTPGQEWLSSFGVEGLLMMVIFGAVGYLLYRRRKDISPIAQARVKKM